MLILFLIVQLYVKDIIGQEKDRVACDGVIFDDVYFDKQLLFKDLGRPYNLVVHKFSDVLFFSHTIQNESHVDFGITCCQIEKKLCRDIIGVTGGYAIAYDAGNDDIYFGGHDGIFKYNFLTNRADFFAEQGKSIWGLFVKRHFYYIEYPSQKLYVYQDDAFVGVAEAKNIEIDNFFISKNKDVYFSNKTALYKVEKNTKDPLHLDDEIAVRQIVEDGYGDVYFVTSTGIYIENKPYMRTKQIAAVEQAFGMTFDDLDRVIYSDKDSIYRLLPSPYNNLCYEALTRHKAAQKVTNRPRVVSREILKQWL